MTNSTYWSPKRNNGALFKNLDKKKLLKNFGLTGGIIVFVILVLGGIGYFVVFQPALSVLAHVNNLRQDVVQLERALVKRDLVQMRAGLKSTRDSLELLRNDRENKFGWAKNLPVLSTYHADSEHFINSGLYALDAAEEFATVITPFADAIGIRVSPEDKVNEELSLLEAFQSWVSIMPKVADDMDGIIVKVAKIGEELDKVDASRYPERIGNISIRSNIEFAQKTLVRANEYAPDIKVALKIIPDLLGVGTGEKRYAIIMQNDAEIRATGGFWTNYATFKVQNAMLSSDFTSKDMYSIDFALQDLDAFIDFPSVPLAYERYLKVERMFARDANISPDYPTAIEQFEYFYNLAMQQQPWEVKPVEGFVAIDTRVVEELLAITGPVTVNGTTFSEENVVLELEKIASLSLAEQANRKGILGDLMEGMLINVFESDKNLWPKLFDKAVSLAYRKHIVGFLYNEQGQALLEKYNFAGRIKDPVEGDYAYVVSTNLGGDKTNLFVTKEVEHTLEKQGNDYIRNVTLSYTYNDSAPEFAPLVKVYRDWIRLYVPKGAELISIEGSIDNELGAGEERGKTWFSGFVTLNPLESKIVTFKYKLPRNVVVADEDYTLHVQKQPGINTEKHTVKYKDQTVEAVLTTDKTFTIKLQ